ncbi:uncharacterized protein LOC123541776 [Mercenaria mercenaria]|uniref:uncharacterized protein LOC123541776 n=1 Tax=Mercenaria mercenaria TaxID=6596 RepID=UPI00234E3ADB|nr:uncharacterized protein LOC123541776 [Mercenaria mercenaria]
MDKFNDNDLMSKVMNRRLGGGTSSCETSPVKQHTLSTDKGSYTHLDSQNCLSSSKYPNNGSTMASFSKSEHHEGLTDIDEVDGFTENEIENGNCKDVEYDKSIADRNAEAADFDVNRVRQNHATTEKDLDHGHGEYEYVLTNEDFRDTAEPRIQMYDESDSNSSNNPFILSSFQSLNASNNAYVPETSAENKTANGMETEDYDKSSTENSQEFGWKSSENYYDSSSQSSSHCLYQNDKDTVTYVDNFESVKQIKKPRSDNSISKFENSPVLKLSESQQCDILKSVLHSEGSDTENGSQDFVIDNKITRDKSGNKISAVFGIDKEKENNYKETDTGLDEKKMTDINFKEAEIEFALEDRSDNNDIRINDKEDAKKEMVEKSIVKKSRKQYVPKRVKKIETSIANGSDGSAEVIQYSESNEVIERNLLKLKEAPGNVQEAVDEGIVKENHEVTPYEEVEQKKSEKSRKQCKPRRIDQFPNINEKTSVHDNENEETETVGIVSNSNDGTEKKFSYMKENEFQKIQKDESEIIENKQSNEYVSEVNENTRYNDLDRSSESLDESCKSSIKENEGETTENAVCSLQNTPDRGNINHFTSLSSNPFYYGFSPDLNLISSLTPGMLQGSSSPGGFALDENGPENLEVIRQLREIRCNRYRKISIAEKREISAYASAHGVSQAATYYNVSKSAVSMWTKLDFSNADEDSGVKRKNCMSGNEKFEALCRKVKSERENKFKGMSKQDKFEVSRYAKLVGVREMSRCLGVALGTVSGWMRQFPYKVETESPDDSKPNNSNKTKDNIEKGETTEVKAQNEKSVKRRKSEQNSDRIKKRRNSETVALDTDSYKTIQKDNTMYILPVDAKIENVEGDLKDNEESVEASATESDLDCSVEQKDELDKMIAETWQKPDAEKCFEDIKEMIKDSQLEGDNFFRSLFDRVIECRADKYKTLKPSEKLEVVRYAKRIGVRRVAKIMGLATGTLSGWNTKYQSSLGLTDPSLDMSNKNDLLVSYLSPDKEIEKVPMTPGALMDNNQKSEVTAVKLLFKDRFPTLLQKIEIAKQVKFKNITTDEKIEFVKCSKLVGIRPTARVFGIPIGTLSGWISKYSKLLHPAYHVDVDQETAGSLSDGSSQIPHIGVHSPNIVGRNAGFQGGLSSNPAWPQMPGFIPGGQGVGLNLFPQLQGMPSSALPVSSTYSSSELFSSPSYTNGTVSEGHSDDTENDSKQPITSQRKIYNDNQSVNFHDKGNISDVQDTENQSIKTEPEEFESQSASDDFEKEAKLMAEQYLTAAYKKMGIPIG